MPHELGWQRFPCWRCKGTGQLPPDDPYVRRDVVTPSKPWPRVAVSIVVWWWAYLLSAMFAIGVLLWP